MMKAGREWDTLPVAFVPEEFDVLPQCLGEGLGDLCLHICTMVNSKFVT